MTRSATANVMIEAARKAARNLVRDFGEVEQLQVSLKGPADYVSAADRKAEDTLMKALSRARPDYGFLFEEKGEVEGADKTHRWIIDPLDGTTNFLHGIPLFAISIALERDGQVVAGLVHNPVMDEIFYAERGKGAFVNDRRMRVSARRNLEDAVITCGIAHRGRGDHGQNRKEIASLQPIVSGIRRTGAAALDLAWLAAGRFDGFFERALKPWDIAAGVLLVREAGGMVSDYQGRDLMLKSGDIVAAANDTLHLKLRNALKSA